MVYTIKTMHISLLNNLCQPRAKKDPASAGSNQSVPGTDLAIQEGHEFFAEYRAAMGVVELISV